MAQGWSEGSRNGRAEARRNGRSKGRHRKPKERTARGAVRVLALLGASILVGAAAALVATTEDPRWLRAAAAFALAGALLPAVSLRLTEHRPGIDPELVALRQEVARLRADVAAFAAMPRPRAAETPLTTLHLPLVRAAFAAPAGTNGHEVNGHGTNGHGTKGHSASVVLDLTDALSIESGS